MGPSFIFRHWSKKKMAMLMKSTGTIEDIDGECSLKVSGMASQSCPIAAHYRVPLRAINKKFGLYRKIVIHLTDSQNRLAIQLRDTYLSVMDYMHNVRIAFFADARGSADPLEAGFRSPALDYYLWLDHKIGGFHDRSREILEKDHNVTLTSLQNRQGNDIIALLDWGAYHTTNCHEHDLCGAFQGSVSEEDLQKLLHAVDSSMDGSTMPKEPRSTTPVRPMDQPHRTISVTDAMVDSETLLDAVDTVMDAPLAPNEPDSTKIVDQTIEMSDVVSMGGKSERTPSGDAVEGDACVTITHEDTFSAGSPTSVLRPFPLPFDWTYCKRALRTMGIRSTRVDLSRWFIAHIVVRMRELYGLDEDTPLDDTFQSGSVSEASYAEYCEMYAMSHFLNATQTIPQERQSMAQFFISAARGLSLSNVHIDCAVQCDAETSGTPVYSDKTSYDGGVQLELCTHFDASEPHRADQGICTTDSVLPDYIADMQPTGADAESSTGQLHIPSDGAEQFVTLDCDNPCLSAADWTLMVVDISNHQSGDPTSHITPPGEMLTDTRSGAGSMPLAKLRPRNLNKDKPSMTVSNTRRRRKLPSQHDVDSRPSLGRPVVFAATRQQEKKKARIASPPVANYTMEDLMSESQINATSIQPSIHSFLLDPKRDEFIQSKITSQYNTFLFVARRVASALMTESLSEAVITAASTLMKIELWLEDVALECKEALEKKDMSLSPLAHNVLVQLSTRASQDGSSLRSELENYILVNSKLHFVITVVQYLCKLRVSQSGADIQYEAGFRLLATIVKAHQC